MMPQLAPLTRLSESDLASLPESTRAALLGIDGVAACEALLALVEEIPCLSSHVADRDRWLVPASHLVAAIGRDCPVELQTRMLVRCAQTALAGRRRDEGLSHAARALSIAIADGDTNGEVWARAIRLPHLVMASPAEAAFEARSLDLALGRESWTLDNPFLAAEVGLAKAAWSLGQRDLVAARECLRSVRATGVQSTAQGGHVACALGMAEAVLQRREGQRRAAVRPLLEVVALAKSHGAHAEHCHARAMLAALAMEATSFEDAAHQAESALRHAFEAGPAEPQPSPWLGLPVDLCGSLDVADAVQRTAVAALDARDAYDGLVFFLTVLLLGATYLADSRAEECVEAIEEGAAALREIAAPALAVKLESVGAALTRLFVLGR